jgi:hypothetical protein
MLTVTYADCHLRRASLMLSVTYMSFMLSVIIMNVIILSVVMLNVVMLSAIAPHYMHVYKQYVFTMQV